MLEKVLGLPLSLNKRSLENLCRKRWEIPVLQSKREMRHLLLPTPKGAARQSKPVFIRVWQRLRDALEMLNPTFCSVATESPTSRLFFACDEKVLCQSKQGGQCHNTLSRVQLL